MSNEMSLLMKGLVKNSIKQIIEIHRNMNTLCNGKYKLRFYHRHFFWKIIRMTQSFHFYASNIMSSGMNWSKSDLLRFKSSLASSESFTSSRKGVVLNA